MSGRAGNYQEVDTLGRVCRAADPSQPPDSLGTLSSRLEPACPGPPAPSLSSEEAELKMWLCLRAVRQRPCFLPTPRSQGRTRTLALHTVQPSQARRPQSSGKEAERAFGPTAPASLCSQPACFNTDLAHPTDGVQETGRPCSA